MRTVGLVGTEKTKAVTTREVSPCAPGVGHVKEVRGDSLRVSETTPMTLLPEGVSVLRCLVTDLPFGEFLLFL